MKDAAQRAEERNVRMSQFGSYTDGMIGSLQGVRPMVLMEERAESKRRATLSGRVLKGASMSG